ncbi:MAG: hypothetical protein E7590_09645 [Ruminococcaceae bacterium]|nr:hypothetical protein [Oscillospiraceae bacterium]
MKKKVLITSILTIVVCLCLIVGSTFALFTSESELNIAVTAGKVEMIANLETFQLFSVEADENGAEVDENGNTYTYQLQQDKFLNGGTAVYENGVLTLDKITPGDKISFTLTGTNNSNVLTNYRWSLVCTDGFALMSGLIVTIDGVQYESLAKYITAWDELAANTAMDSVELSIELPVAAGNEYQELSTSIRILVEAVQSNGIVEDESEISYISIPGTPDELATAIEDPNVPVVTVFDDIDDVVTIDADLKDKTIDANGKNVALKFTGALENVVVTGINDTADEVPAVTLTNSTSGDITIADSVLYSGAKIPYGCIAASGSYINVDVTVDNCELISGSGAVDENGDPVYGDKYGLYMTNAKSVTVQNTTFEGFGSWAIMVNGTIDGDVVVSDCEFINCAGVLKTSVGGQEPWQVGLINGDLIFVNNTMTDCTTKNGVYASTKTAGTITFENNSLNGVDNVTAADMLGMN